MTMAPRLRVLMLTAHVTSSVGFLGAVAAFLALAVAGLTGTDAEMVHAAYLAMELVTWFVIVPLCIASLLSGVIQSLGTHWGLFRHYWVLLKLLLTLLSAIVLFVHTQPIRLAAQAEKTGLSDAADLGELRFQLTVAAGAALLVLLVSTVLSIYKPQGVTPYGWRKQHQPRKAVID
jgi:hypothetical protein